MKSTENLNYFQIGSMAKSPQSSSPGSDKNDLTTSTIHNSSSAKPLTQKGKSSHYKKLNVREDVLDTLLNVDDINLTSFSGNSEEISTKLSYILSEDEFSPTVEYYWRLVYSVAFQLYKQAKINQWVNKNGPLKQTPFISLKMLSDESGIKIHNLRRVFIGHGRVLNMLKFMLFLKSYNISLTTLATYGPIVEKAYHYGQLAKAGIDPEDRSRTFF